MNAPKLAVTLRQHAEQFRTKTAESGQTDRDDFNTHELILVLARVVEGKPVNRAFGAPGDWGYNTAIGSALAAAPELDGGAKSHAAVSHALRADPPINNLQHLQNRILPWQRETFPKQSVKSKLMGMMRETRTELIPHLGDLTEWADVLIYFTGAAAKHGFTMDEIVAAAHAKMDVNIARKWGKPDRHGLCHHIEEGK